MPGATSEAVLILDSQQLVVCEMVIEGEGGGGLVGGWVEGR